MPNPDNPAEETPNPGVEEPPITPDPETPPAPETPEAPAPATADQMAETNRVLREVADSLKSKPGQAAPSQAQVRELIKEKTGLSDAGIDWVMQFNRDTVIAAVSPISEKMAWTELRSSKAGTAFPITPEIEKAMKDELKQYAPELQGDGVLLEKIYLIEIGKQAIKAPAAPRTPASNPPNPVVRRTIVTNNPNPAGGNGGGNTPAPAGSQLSDDEKRTARKMGVSEAEYSKWKKTTVIQPAAVQS